MTDILARAYVLSRLTDGQLYALHVIERREGYLMPPAWIHDHFNTEPWGDVTEASQNNVSSEVHGVWGEMEAQARAKGQFPLPEHCHAVDIAIRRKGLTFSVASAGSKRAEILRGKRPVPAMANENDWRER